MKRALLSVADKTGIVDFARGLAELGYDIISSGGTAKCLRDSGIPASDVQDVTGFPEMMDGRVKTLHPKVHGGILMRRDISDDLAVAADWGILPIDVICVNLYPFAATISRPHALEDAIENIDIGGPAMVRSAAKNHKFVAVVTNPKRYEEVLRELRDESAISLRLRRELAVEAFMHTAHYDSIISFYFHQAYGMEGFPEELAVPMKRHITLRYGENPHQQAALYREPTADTGLMGARQIQGKELSFCNINDANAALELVKEFTEPAVVAVKHATPCGVALGGSIYEAYSKAYAADPVSIFGGIVATNGTVDAATAEAMSSIFLDVVIAPEFTDEALLILGKKKNLRLLTVSFTPSVRVAPSWDLKRVEGGYLLQTPDLSSPPTQWRTVTTSIPDAKQLADLAFGWTVVKHVKSNAIVIVRDGVTIGIGMGQTNRIDPTLHAIARAGERTKGAILASDAFFPMPDVLEKCAEAGIAAVIHPGGSLRDEDSIKVAEQAGIAMVVTGERHFRH
jgi:phosphoribosylaminoimidazolecarboxamide formyltransferase/IMP cyclohydrolase